MTSLITEFPSTLELGARIASVHMEWTKSVELEKRLPVPFQDTVGGIEMLVISL